MASQSRGLPMTHAELQKAITDLAKALGIWSWHDNYSRRNKAGLPDLLLVGPKPRADGGPAELWRELKVPPDTLKPPQRKVGERMVAAGIDWDVWWLADWHSGRIQRELGVLSGRRRT
jgi:hypothetical protein